jgi:hypothetical protein
MLHEEAIISESNLNWSRSDSLLCELAAEVLVGYHSSSSSREFKIQCGNSDGILMQLGKM